jgi:hypothetical protein
MTTGFKSFSELYRAAFAESDPERKNLLLSQVKKALDDWQRGVAPQSTRFTRPTPMGERPRSPLAA